MSVFNMVAGGGNGSLDGLTWEVYKTVSFTWNNNTKKYTVTCNQLSKMPEAGACSPVGNLVLAFIGDTAEIVRTGSGSTVTLESFSRTSTGFTATISSPFGASGTSYGYFLIPTN